MQSISLHVGMAVVQARIRVVVLMLCGEAWASFQAQEQLGLSVEEIWAGADHFRDTDSGRINCATLLYIY